MLVRMLKRMMDGMRLHPRKGILGDRTSHRKNLKKIKNLSDFNLNNNKYINICNNSIKSCSNWDWIVVIA
jgi:hypothetical protein